MDVDAYVVTHRAEWARLEELSRRRRLSGTEADELVALYQRTAAHLAVVQAASPDPALVARLSALVAHARAAITGAHTPTWRAVAAFATRTFPAAVWRARWWVLGAALASVVVAVALGAWVTADPTVATRVAPSTSAEELRRQFVDYYFANAHGSFAFKVWTNNAWVAAQCLLTGISLVFPAWVLLQNAANVGLVGGLLARDGQLGTFFLYIAPHGLLELTAIFTAAGVGMRLGWTLVDPGPRTRAQALGTEGRAMGAVALGLVPVFAVAGVLEGFVTPSGLPAAARVAVGVLAWAGIIAYVVVLGSRAARSGQTGDVDEIATAPTAG